MKESSNPHFRAWVANAVHAISGIWPLDWQGSERKRALTVEEIRAGICQEAFADSLEVWFRSRLWDSESASANQPKNSRKLH